VSETNPIGDWLQVIADKHDATRHREGVICRGSIDLIDSAARLRGVASVRNGNAISLEKPVETRAGRGGESADKVQLEVQVGGQDRSVAGGEKITIDPHGGGNTHMDSTAHMGLDNQWHGGIPAKASNADDDALVAWAQHGVATRGVMLDIVSLRGVPWVTPEEPVTGEDLDAALAATGVTLEPGDALMIYMGRDHFDAAGNVYPTGYTKGRRSGIGVSGAQWIADQQPSLVAWDFHDARRLQRGLEVHMLIWAIGLCLIDNSNLGPAARALRAADVSTGLLVAPPLGIYRSTGTLINPLLLY
jgi:hypothetical protein